MTVTPAAANAATPGIGLPYTVASRPQRRYSQLLQVNNFLGAGSFPVTQLAATGWVRRIHLYFQATFTGGTGAYNPDSPFNLISAITLADATGQPVFQPISGYNLYLQNKYFGTTQNPTVEPAQTDPRIDPGFAPATTAVNFRLTLDFEIDNSSGYGCIPNLDSNASLQLKVDYANQTVTGLSTVTASSLTMRAETEYWAPVGSTQGGAAVNPAPPGAGDFREVRYETQPVSASSENLMTLTNRGGLIQSIILVSRAAGVRTAFTALSNVGIVLDNQPINEGIPLESHQNQVRRSYGYNGSDITNTATALTSGAADGLDTGVVVLPFHLLSGGRDSWLNTRAGSLLQVKVTPGAGATQMEVITGLMQVKDPASFYHTGN